MPLSKNSNKYSDGDGSYQQKIFYRRDDWASGKTKKNVQKISKNAENKKMQKMTPKSCFLGLIEIDEVINVQKLCKFHQNITETGY